MDHLFALIRAASEFGVRQVYVHVFTDGRDTPPKSALGYLRQLESTCTRYGTGEIASVTGRFYAMDRDKRWDRVARAYQALVKGTGQGVLQATSAEKAINAAYDRGESDEFIQPTVIASEGRPKGLIKDGDAVIFFNFRADRAREISRALTQESFDGFARGSMPKLAQFVTMTQYEESLGLKSMFPPQAMTHLLGEVISDAGYKQLRIAETEKYAHVTYFFNGGNERAFAGEDRLLIPSPREVQTYDEKPEMALAEVTRQCVGRIESGEYAFVLCNFANPDMLGHTGKLDAAIAAIEEVDRSLGAIVDATLNKRGRVLITADHGNCETMVDPETGEPHTAHTTNPVPFIVVDPARKNARVSPGTLSDVAPTVLHLMGLPVPQEMTGKNLIDDRGL
jgi:2,3-bisphosphoglycerate-independent phosphoglycerate mutase